MILSFFRHPEGDVYALRHRDAFSAEQISSLEWLFGGAKYLQEKSVAGPFIGPRPELITPWSTNAIEVLQNMNLSGVDRIERFTPGAKDFDPLLSSCYERLDEELFRVDCEPEPIHYIEDIEAYNEQEGLALSEEEIVYLKGVVEQLGRPLSDSELFGFSQVNSEHCRHKIFGGRFVVDGEEKEMSLFSMIKETSKQNPNNLVSAYKDNVAFNRGPKAMQFAPEKADRASLFKTKEIETVLSLKAETHNFPTTVEPFNGAATGSGGEIRDRLAGGRASLPLAGTAVYMTSYTRHPQSRHGWEKNIAERKWLYHSPSHILSRASDGASDFGNKFGQPLICGSVLTFEHEEQGQPSYGYDKVIMLAGGIGFANKRDALKGEPKPGESVVVMGGDNYRVGMGGGAVSSVDTGHYVGAIELNAVQRSNPEMQKRVANVVRAMAEADSNPIVSIHDHGAGGHLNCLSELVEQTGGKINVDRLPVGDPTLSAKEIIGNESQERMGLLVGKEDIAEMKKIAERERAPFYVVGETTDDMAFIFEKDNGERPIDLMLEHMFGSAPKTVMTDNSVERKYANASYDEKKFMEYLPEVLAMEAVGCKDFLTNKVDRSVSGKVAMQQCMGELQLPLSDLGAMAIDFKGKAGVATSIGHAPQVALIDSRKGSEMAIAEALTNIVGAPLRDGLSSISLSANWMWPCKHPGEDARLYNAVEACAELAIDLGINIPTGKDSLSMTQKYPDGKQVLSPGTVIISAAGEVTDVRKIVSPVIQNGKKDSSILYIDFSFAPLALGGSAFYQSLNALGTDAPEVGSAEYFVDAFEAVQSLVKKGLIDAIHDISAGGIVTTLLEMLFANSKGGLKVNLTQPEGCDAITRLFAENPGVVVQISDFSKVASILDEAGVAYEKIGSLIEDRKLEISVGKAFSASIPVDEMRAAWFAPSFSMETLQSSKAEAESRARNLGFQPLKYKFGSNFKGTFDSLGIVPDRENKASGIRAAIVRDKGTNGEREMAYALYTAGFDVKDIHMTDLTSGRETLEDIDFLVFCGGFSNSDVFGSAKGWAAGFLHNPLAKKALDAFYARENTLSLGICNGCQLMAELGVLYPSHTEKHRMEHNRSGRFESSFVSVDIPENKSVMFGSLSGSSIPVWVAHGEGRFALSLPVSEYNVVAQYSYAEYPGNPNGSDHNIAALASPCGRHLAMMPHPERCVFPWQAADYIGEGYGADVTPWMEAFVNAYNWIKDRK